MTAPNYRVQYSGGRGKEDLYKFHASLGYVHSQFQVNQGSTKWVGEKRGTWEYSSVVERFCLTPPPPPKTNKQKPRKMDDEPTQAEESFPV